MEIEILGIYESQIWGKWEGREFLYPRCLFPENLKIKDTVNFKSQAPLVDVFAKRLSV